MDCGRTSSEGMECANCLSQLCEIFMSAAPTSSRRFTVDGRSVAEDPSDGLIVPRALSEARCQLARTRLEK